MIARIAWLAVGLLGGCRSVVAPPSGAPGADPSEAWEAKLAEVVSEDGYVDYARLAEDRAPLDRFVAWLAKDRPRMDRDNTQHALWLNAYNALAIYGVLHDGVPASVVDVPGWLPMAGSGFFVERAYVVQGEEVSLHEIAHQRLFGRVMDLRDHAAINGALRGGPPVRGELYQARRVEEQLRDQMGRWVDDDDRGVRLEGDRALFNTIFDAYAWELSFLSAGDDLCAVAARFASEPKAARLSALSEAGCPHGFFVTDWSLNAAR